MPLIKRRRGTYTTPSSSIKTTVFRHKFNIYCVYIVKKSCLVIAKFVLLFGCTPKFAYLSAWSMFLKSI